jgi:hypothetical protein
MDISVNPASGVAAQIHLSPPVATVPVSDSTPLVSPPSVDAKLQAQLQASTDSSVAQSANLQEQAVQQALTAFNYPLGNKEFSIFKDVTGQYITRYVSLQDGSVTYVPAPTLVKQTQLANVTQNPLVALDV